MKYSFYIIFILFLLFSCKTTPEYQMLPSWLSELPQDEKAKFFASSLPEETPDANEMLMKNLASDIMASIGFDPVNGEPRGQELYGELEMQILGSLLMEEGSSLDEVTLIEQGIFTSDDGVILAALVRVDNAYLKELENKLIPYFLEEVPEMDEIAGQVDSYLEQGLSGSAFLLQCRAVKIASELNSPSAQYLLRNNVEKAAAILESAQFRIKEPPGDRFSGEQSEKPLTLTLPMDESLGERLWYEVRYPHGMDSEKQTLASVQSDFSGRMIYQEPPVFIEGNYELSVSLDINDILQRMGLSSTEEYPALEQVLESKHWVYPFSVFLDLKKLSIGIYITDRDGLNKPVQNGTTGSKSLTQFREEGYLISPISGDIEISSDRETPGILRELIKIQEEPSDLMLLGETRIIDYQTQEERVTITGVLTYRLWDMRTYRVLKEGRVEKQWESRQSDQALNNLHTQLSRALVQEINAF